MDFKEILNNLKERFQALNKTQQILVVSIPIALALIAGIIFYLTSRVHYTVLFGDLNNRDMAAIVEQLEKDNVKYKITQDGRTILVPEGEARQLRLKLAAMGLPTKGYPGFKLLDKMPLGITDFMQHVEYQRALEQELANTILGFSNIEKAKVNLAMPKPSIFITENQKPSASVFIELKPGASITRRQVIAIRNLVAASVPDLTPDRVTVVDSNGVDLTEELNNPSSYLTNEQLRVKTELENSITKHLEQVLGQALGYNNVRVAVDVEPDFSQVETQSKNYNPNTTAIVSQQKKQETTTGTSVSGVPGTASNIPPMSGLRPNANFQSTKKEVTTNYDVSVEKTHVVDKTIRIKRMSVGVIVNADLKNINLNSIRQLVVAAAGVDPKRGDTVSVIAVPFYKPVVPKPPIYLVYAKYGIAGVLTLLLLGILLFVLLKLRKKPEVQELPAVSAAMEALESLETEELREKAKELVTVDKMIKITKENPDKVAKIIKHWLTVKKA